MVVAACAPRDAAPAATRSASGHVSVAAIFSGPVDDKDFNHLGLLALRAVRGADVTTTYTPQVATADAERILSRYAQDGNTILWAHGGQFYDAAAAVARAYPRLTVIAEFDGHPPDQPPNLWVLDRQFHLGFYAIGVLAAKMSVTGTVGYVGGLQLPFSHSEVHAIEQAFTDVGAGTHLRTAWTGDFNDAVAARQATARLIADGADVILGSLNGGAIGIFRAAADAGHRVFVTTKYADKSAMDVGHDGIATLVYDFSWPLKYVLAMIGNNVRTGYFPMGFAAGVSVQLADSVPPEAQRAVNSAIAAISGGQTTVALNTAEG